MTPRPLAYQDPLDRVWIACAERVGLKVERGRDAYASYDGRGVLHVGEADTLDDDDCLAQMVFHELVHAAVQRGAGVDAFALSDWGLDNRSERDAPRERATLRVQAEYARRCGLRAFLAPTTEYRPFYDALSDDPLAGAPHDEAAAARAALACLAAPPFAPHLDAALEATAAIVRAAEPFSCAGTASLFDRPAVLATGGDP